MRQGISRTLLVLALLVPLSRLTFADDTFAVTGTLDLEYRDVVIPTITGPSFTYEGFNPAGGGRQLGFGWDIGASVQPSFMAQTEDGDWTLDGLPGGSEGFSTFTVIVPDPFTVEYSPEFGLEATDIPIIWTGEIDLYSDDGTMLYTVYMEGVGTADFGGYPMQGDPDQIFVDTADFSLTGGAVVTPEPSTLTLMGIAGIALFLGIGLRRRYFNAQT
jgi:hypothetical protein